MLTWHTEKQPVYLVVRLRAKQCQLIGYNPRGRIVASLALDTQPVMWAGEASPEEYRLFLEKTGLTRTDSVRNITGDARSSGNVEESRKDSADPHTEASEGAG